MLGFLIFTAEALLFAFALRRIALILGAWLPRKPSSPPQSLPAVAVLVPARNEESNLPSLFQALTRLEYPAELVSFTLVNDGSSDRTAQLLTAWAATPQNVRVAHIETGGKSAALAAAMAQAPASDLIVTFDADCVPSPDALRNLAAAFADPRVGAAGGLCRPSNPLVSIVSRYSSLEFWVHHFVNLSGKDRWGMDPVPSACIAAYRRDALVHVGGFLPGVADDVSTTLRILAAGYKSRYIVNAVVESSTVTTISQLIAQRRRWSANLHHGAGSVRGIETLVVASGYLDRIVFAACVVLAIAGAASWFVVAFYVAAILTSMITGLVRAGYAKRIPEFFAVAAIMAPVELWLSLPVGGPARVQAWNPPGRSPSKTR